MGIVKSIFEKSKWHECDFSGTTFRGVNLTDVTFNDTCHGLNIQGAIGYRLRLL